MCAIMLQRRRNPAVCPAACPPWGRAGISSAVLGAEGKVVTIDGLASLGRRLQGKAQMMFVHAACSKGTGALTPGGDGALGDKCD